MAKTTLRVTLADETEVDVTPTLEDTLAFETTLRKNKQWGNLSDSALKMQPFKAWNALRRQGLTELSWDEFTTGTTAALNVVVVQDDEFDTDEEEVKGLGKGSPTGASQRSSSPSPSAQESSPVGGLKLSEPTPAP